MMPVKKSGLGLQYPVTSAKYKYLSSIFTSCELIGSVKEEREISTADHLLAIREEMHDILKMGWHQQGQDQGTSQVPQST